MAAGPLVALLAVGVFVVVAPTGLKSAISDWLSGLNPLSEETVDRTGPSVLVSLTDLSEYRAATGYYETVVDIENDSKLPSWIKGERVLYVGKGDVAAFVDFGELDEQRVVVSEDRLSATIRLPAPQLDKPVLDLEKSYVVDHDSGFMSNFGGSDLEREAQLTAVRQMATAATDTGALVDLARKNTAAMLRGLLGGLGYVDVTVTWDDEPTASPSPTPSPQ
ncbi:DUF4230 domain-containing protein [Nocardioides humi]|uniref:DUF4230 domain-containing protein n=1 Tax=Nocardioides humi TaxID=449461 RepID=A0ABN2AVB7_9ACTN